jgi:STE24 endopeptidase
MHQSRIDSLQCDGMVLGGHGYVATDVFWTMVSGGGVSLSCVANEIFHSILFYFVGQLPVSLTQIPLSYYSTFILEEKFGFNKQTKTLFFKDLLMTQALTLAIGPPLLAILLKIIDYYGKLAFMFYVMLFLIAVQVIMIALYPILIQPLFNKLRPLEDGVLKSQTEALAKKLKFPLGKLWVIDGSKRSAHSNAYFYGLPWSKQIVSPHGQPRLIQVIYDTLIEQSEPMEVVAVLAHELGHWANWDTTRQLCVVEVTPLASVLMRSTYSYSSSSFPRSLRTGVYTGPSDSCRAKCPL